jgi:hypothetical protein
MASVYSNNLQIYNAEQFKKSLETGNEKIYFTFGRVGSWANDAEPPQANTSVTYFYEVWKNMLGAKKIQASDVRLGAKRTNWTANTVYHAYDDCGCSLLQNNPNSRYFIVTNDWNVYKCISNNNGSISTVNPTSTFVSSSIQTSDNYIWKYMYTLNDEERLRFVTSSYIPVKTLTADDGSLQWQVQDASIFGSIEAVVVTNGGSGYDANSLPTITLSGDGSGAGAVATVNTSTTSIERIIITNKGAGYTYANVSISSTSNTATARAIVSPPGGHGHNPLEELGASSVIINTRIRGTEDNILDIANEIRQISIIRDPYLKDTETLASNLVYSQTTTLNMDAGISNYLEDEFVYQGASLESASFRGTVASWDLTTNKLELVDIIGNPTTDVLIGHTSKVSRLVSSVTPRDLETFSGSLLYIDNIAPIQRAADQTEDFKIVISF